MSRLSSKGPQSAKNWANAALSPTQPYPPYQWGEPRSGQTSFDLVRSGDLLEIDGVISVYDSTDRPCDMVQQYERARKAHRRAAGSSKHAPHIRFANAQTEAELIAFVRQFGPVVASSWTNRMPVREISDPTHDGNCKFEFPVRAVQSLREQINEQRIYSAALLLILELRKPTDH
jgi:hypothetical protein